MKYDFEKIEKEKKKLHSFILNNGLLDFFEKYSGVDQFVYDIDYVNLWFDVCRKIVQKSMSVGEAEKIIKNATHEEKNPFNGFPAKAEKKELHYWMTGGVIDVDY